MVNLQYIYAKIMFFHECTKHIDVRLYFIRDIVSQEVIRSKKIHTQYTNLEMDTKVLSLVKFKVVMTF